MAELPKLLANLHCGARFRNRTQSLESGKAEYAFEIVWKLPERATPPRAPAYGRRPSAERVIRHHHRDGFRYHDGRAVGRALAGKLGIGSAHRREKPAREKRPEDRLSLDHRHSSTSLDLFDHCAFVRFNNIGPIVALKGAILAQARRFPIDFIGEGSDLHQSGKRSPIRR